MITSYEPLIVVCMPHETSRVINRMKQIRPERPNFSGSHRARSIQPKFRAVRPGKEDHLKRWTCFFETFPVGPSRSIEFWTEISRNFGWMDRAHTFPLTVPAGMLFSKRNENRARSQVSWKQGCRWAVVHAVPIVKQSINRWGHDWWHWCKSSLFQAPRWWWKVRWKLNVVQ